MHFRLKVLVLSLAAILCALPCEAGAQAGAGISGRVADAAGTPRANAVVSLVELRRTIVTADDGMFAFGSVPAGRYTLSVRLIGYAPVVLPASPGATVNVTLQVTPFILPALSVTAGRTPQSAQSIPLATSMLREEQLRREQSISLAHSLVTLPGVRSVSTGLQIGKPMIRGFYGARVLVLSDGSRMEDYSWSQEDAPSLDARLAERVEVIRGPASVLFGSDALGGVVNVIPEDLPFTNGGPSFARFRSDIYFATNNVEKGLTLTYEGASGNIGWRGTAIGRFAKSYDTPAGEVSHTGFEAGNGELSIGIAGERATTTLRFTHFGGEWFLLEARPPAGQEMEEEEGPERKTSDDRLQLAHDRIAGNWRIETRAQFQRHSLIEVSDDCIPPPGEDECVKPPGVKETTAFDLLLNTGTVDVVAHRNTDAPWQSTLGVSAMLQSNDSKGPIFLVPDAGMTSFAGFLLENGSFGNWDLSAGVRLDSRSLTADPNSQIGLTSESNRSWTAFSGDAGAVLHLTDMLSLTGNLGLAWRAPTLFDLYSNGPHLAEVRYEIGDPEMDIERSTNIDVGARAETRRIRAEVNWFSNNVADYIYVQPTSEIQDELRVFRHVQNDARVSGMEGEIAVNVVDPLTLELRHDRVRGTNTTTDEPLPLMPTPRTVVGARYRNAGGRFTAGAALEMNAKQSRPNAEDLVTGAYTLLNLDFGLTLDWKGRILQLDLGVRNALDEKYKNFLSRYKEFAYDPGRSIVVRVSIP